MNPIIPFALAAFCGASAQAQVLFSDDFDAGASPLWSNVRGNWRVNAGRYEAGTPGNLPPTFSAVQSSFTDVIVDVDVIAAIDGGIWLRTDAAGMNGVLLVTGGQNQTGRGVYWHRVIGGAYQPAQGQSASLFNSGDSIHVTVSLRGDVYEAYVNGSRTPVSTLTTPLFPSGQIGVYDFSVTGQSFDNVFIRCVGAVVHPLPVRPCPGSDTEFNAVAGGAGALTYRWRKNGVQLDDGPTGSGSTITGATTGTLRVLACGAADEGSYDCLITGSCGSAPSGAATLWLCGADFNCDGTVDFFDYLDFVSAFDIEDTSADFNGDQIVDFFDYLDFAAAFDTGC